MLLTLKFYRERKIMKLEILKNLMGKSQVKRNGFVRNEKKKMYNNNSIGWCWGTYLKGSTVLHSLLCSSSEFKPSFLFFSSLLFSLV